MIDTSQFRDWLQAQCDRFGSQRQLADHADLVNTTIGQLLRSNRAPDSETILKLWQATGTHPYDIWSLLAGLQPQRRVRRRRTRK